MEKPYASHPTLAVAIVAVPGQRDADMSTVDVRRIIETRSVLSGLPQEALDDLLKRARPVRFGKGDAIFNRGDAGDSMKVVLAGRIKVSNVSANAREVVLNFLGPGDLLGELGALDGKERSADAIALEETECLVIYRRDLLSLIEAHPKALMGLVTALTAKLRDASAMVEHGLLQMAGKAAKGLIRLADRHGRRVADGVLVDLKLSQRDLGNYVGLSRENTSRELGRLKDEGLIRIEGSQIVILDLDALHDRADAEDE